MALKVRDLPFYGESSLGTYTVSAGGTTELASTGPTIPVATVVMRLSHRLISPDAPIPVYTPILSTQMQVVGVWPPTLAQLTQFRAYITATMTLMATVVRTGTSYACQVVPDPRRTGGYKILVQDNADVAAGDTLTVSGIGSYAAVGINRFGGYTTSTECAGGHCRHLIVLRSGVYSCLATAKQTTTRRRLASIVLVPHSLLSSGAWSAANPSTRIFHAASRAL